jgi:hypothetical protein
MPMLATTPHQRLLEVRRASLEERRQLWMHRHGPNLTDHPGGRAHGTESLNS